MSWVVHSIADITLWYNASSVYVGIANYGLVAILFENVGNLCVKHTGYEGQHSYICGSVLKIKYVAAYVTLHIYI